jgi:hypothetical protein
MNTKESLLNNKAFLLKVQRTISYIFLVLFGSALELYFHISNIIPHSEPAILITTGILAIISTYINRELKAD